MVEEKEFCICQCFFSRTIFLKDYEADVVFESEEQSQRDCKRERRNFFYLKVSLQMALIHTLAYIPKFKLFFFFYKLPCFPCFVYQELYNRCCKTDEQWREVLKEVCEYDPEQW